MQPKTIISEVKEIGSSNGEESLFPQNRILYVEQFTGDAPDTDDEREVFNPSTKNDVYEHYRPSKEKLSIYDEEGDLFYEDFVFRSINDFETDRLIEQSPTMNLCKSKMDVILNMTLQMQKNRSLRFVMSDKTERDSLITCLKYLREELK